LRMSENVCPRSRTAERLGVGKEREQQKIPRAERDKNTNQRAAPDARNTERALTMLLWRQKNMALRKADYNAVVLNFRGQTCFNFTLEPSFSLRADYLDPVWPVLG
jgi:hypothetical protein